MQHGVSDAISDALPRPIRLTAPADARKPTWPRRSDLLEAIVGSYRTLSIAFADTANGRIAQLLAQRAIEDLNE